LKRVYLPALLLTFLLHESVFAQQPDLSKIKGQTEKVQAWLTYCESLRLNNKGAKDNFVQLEQASLQGVALAGKDDQKDRARFFSYAAFGAYYQIKFDSAQYYFYQSLYTAQEAKSAEYITSACVALIPVNYQLQQLNKVDSIKDILVSILDTTKNSKILEDGDYAMGNYYQQKSYYSTAQDYCLKSIDLRKKEVDTTSDVKKKLDFAIQCYTLAKLYNTTEMYSKSLDVLYEGQRFSGFSPLVDIRYLSAFIEDYSAAGNIDSCLLYMGQLEPKIKNAPTVPSEAVSSNLNIAKYYIEKKQYEKAFPWLIQADTLAKKSKNPVLLYQAALTDGRYYEGKGQYAQSIARLTEGLPTAKNISKEQYAEGLHYMALAQKEAHHDAEALLYYEQYINQQDSLTKEKLSRNFADQETRYETNKKELAILSLNQENKLETLQLENASRVRLFLVIGLVAAGLILLLLYFFYRNKEKLNRILNNQNEKLGDLNSQLAVANETKARLFGIIGHDLRAPVSKIVQLMRLQKENPGLLTAEKKSEHEGMLKNASENVLQTMEDLLLWSKSQMQHFQPQLSTVDVKEILEREANLLEQQAADKQLSIDLQVPSTFKQETDENFVAVIVRNLLQNAVKYGSSQGGNGTVTVTASGKQVVISNHVAEPVADSLNKKLNNMQVDSSASGIGLQIAADLASRINTQLAFRQQDEHTLAAVLSWQ
jgi:signal transduction histidine kinase